MRWIPQSRARRIILGALIVLCVLLLIASNIYEGKPPVKLSRTECNQELWAHVYESDRLGVIENCTAVEGVVDSWHRVGDGDVHIWVYPDRKSVLNLMNVVRGQHRLAVEVICEHASLEPEARSACGSFRWPVTLPNPGDRIRVTGTFVTDHKYGWNEIHPVTRIEILH